MISTNLAAICPTLTAPKLVSNVMAVTRKAHLMSQTDNWSAGTAIAKELLKYFAAPTKSNLLTGESMKRICCLLSVLLILAPAAQVFAGQKTNSFHRFSGQ